MKPAKFQRQKRRRRRVPPDCATPGPAGGSERLARRCRRGTNIGSTPTRAAVQNYQFPPCGGTPTYFSRNVSARQPRRAGAMSKEHCENRLHNLAGRPQFRPPRRFGNCDATTRSADDNADGFRARRPANPPLRSRRWIRAADRVHKRGAGSHPPD